MPGVGTNAQDSSQLQPHGISPWRTPAVLRQSREVRTQGSSMGARAIPRQQGRMTEAKAN